MTGEIKSARTMILRVHVGSAADDEGKKYDLSTGGGTGCPIVHSRTTGQYFILGWSDIIRLAVEAGIDFDDPPLCDCGHPKSNHHAGLCPCGCLEYKPMEDEA